ncbi:hypothetical protein HDC90_000136 [Pedobacter sp. AK013]|uniref:6-bladed beta-propeller n=1 Tax=Pedobacter sp. AK013 TaxID=2723071 RepID=UPI001620C3CD|nr:6-bladed beta-propeller [Pedobacter sp. AK013]MBB6235539.1 hypothetical protein [Pedobacter sp. AK013]
MKILIRFFFLFCACLGFSTSFSQEPAKLRIDLDRSYGGAFSEYLTKLEYIPLENTKISRFGQISNLILTDSSFVITDRDTKSILFFSPSGKFLNKVSKRGTLYPTGAIFNSQKNTIDVVFQDIEKTKLAFENYSLVGMFVSKANINDVNIDFVRNGLFIDKNNFWLRYQFSEKETFPTHYFTQYRNNKKVGSAVPYDSSNAFALFYLTKELGHFNLPVTRSGKFYFATPLTNKIYEVSSLTGNTIPLFQVIFPAKFSIQNSLLAIQDKKKIDSAIHTKWFNDQTVLGLENIICDENKLIFKTHTGLVSRYGADGAVIPRNFFYRFKDNRLVAFEKVSPDPSTYFLPFHSQGTISTEGFYFKNDYLYTHLSSLEMFGAREATKSKKALYPVALQNYFLTQNRKSNPVIVRMRLKE